MPKNPKITPEMREMAIAILEGDFESAVALRDAIEETKDGSRIPKVKRISNIENIRVLIRAKEESIGPDDSQLQQIEHAVHMWLTHPSTYPLFISSHWEIELYEIDNMWGLEGGLDDNIETSGILNPEQAEEVFKKVSEDIEQQIIDSVTDARQDGMKVITNFEDSDDKLSEQQWLQRRVDTILKKDT